MLIPSSFHLQITFGEKEFLKAISLVFSGGVLEAKCVWILLVR